MEGARFDNWTRKRAKRVSRRGLLGALGLGGLGVAALGPRMAAAQFSGGDGCELELTLQTADASGQIRTFAGTLALEFASDGAVLGGTFTSDTGSSAPVSGHAFGHAVSLLISLPEREVLSLSGVGSDDIVACSSPIQGFCSGPGPNGIGSWIADPGDVSAPSQEEQQVVPTTAPPPAPAEPPAACMPIDCGSLVQDPVSCECVCAPGTTPCGGNCCPAGAACMDGACGCPAGTEQCGTTCVAACPPGQLLDYDLCQCVAEQICVDLGGMCALNADCCSFSCVDGVCN